MPSLMHRGQTLLSSRKLTADGETVSIRRKPHTTTGVTAVVLSVAEELLDQAGNVYVELDRVTFAIPAASYVINGVAVQPMRGDVVTRTDVDGDPQFEIQPLEGDQVWSWANEPARDTYKVSAKYIGDS